MHYLTCVYKICFVKCEKLLKFVFIEVRLASMMRASSPRALSFGSLCASVRLALFKTKEKIQYLVVGSSLNAHLELEDKYPSENLLPPNVCSKCSSQQKLASPWVDRCLFFTNIGDR